jgi:hypothetical protein
MFCFCSPPDALLPNSDWATFSSIQVDCVVLPSCICFATKRVDFMQGFLPSARCSRALRMASKCEHQAQSLDVLCYFVRLVTSSRVAAIALAFFLSSQPICTDTSASLHDQLTCDLQVPEDPAACSKTGWKPFL